MEAVAHLTLPSQHDQNAAARRWVSDCLIGCSAEQIDSAVLAAAELVANAVDSGTGSTVDVEVRRSADRVRIAVSNPGESFEPTNWVHRPEADRGRGLHIVRSLGDTTVRHAEGVTTVEVEIWPSPGQSSPATFDPSRD